MKILILSLLSLGIHLQYKYKMNFVNFYFERRKIMSSTEGKNTKNEKK
jgi:hypothetical protein